MAEQVMLNAERLSEISAQIKQVSAYLEDVEVKIASAQNNLDWEVREKEDIDANITKIKNKMIEQRKKLESILDKTAYAAEKANEYNVNYEKKASAIVTAIIGAVSVFVPFGKSSIINALVKVHDWLSPVNGGNIDNSNNEGNTTSVDYSDTDIGNYGVASKSTWGDKSGDELKSAIEERDKAFLNNPDGTPNMKKENGYAARNTGDGKVNCRWLTQHKIRNLVGRNISFDNMEKMAKAGGVDVNGDHFNIVSLGAPESSNSGNITYFRRVIENIKQPAENIAISWGPSPAHHMFIDKIADGKVYFSDNSGTAWAEYLKTGTLPAQVRTINKFIEDYEGNDKIFKQPEIYQITKA